MKMIERQLLVIPNGRLHARGNGIMSPDKIHDIMGTARIVKDLAMTGGQPVYSGNS